MSERTKLYFESFPSSFDDNRAVRHLSFLLGIPKRSSSVARIPGGRASRILKWYFESYCTSFSSLSHSTLTSPMPGGSSENHSGRLSRICEGYIDLSYLGLHAMVRSFGPASIKRQGVVCQGKPRGDFFAFLMGSVGTIAGRECVRVGCKHNSHQHSVAPEPPYEHIDNDFDDLRYRAGGKQDT